MADQEEETSVDTGVRKNESSEGEGVPYDPASIPFPQV